MVRRIAPGPGQESVWDYPRPPRLEPCARHLEVYFNGTRIADTTRGYRILETSHPPVYYFPPEDVQAASLRLVGRGSYCEWKGEASYYTVRVGDQEAAAAAWCYPRPTGLFAAITNYIAFYAGRMEVCLIDGERVRPQPGGFYGGWVTDDVVGPFKGEPGTEGW
jgi:uncharacterized protein (DUF427 family)